ncbi:MAG: nucleotidyltransferase family protein [Candidatus Heimdallarchaeaceae archaeon]
MMHMISNFPVIVLAAGNSKRMGRPKGLLDFHGKPFISYQIGKLIEIGFKDIIVVLGKDYKKYLEKVPELKRFHIVINPSPERGQFSSIQCGLETEIISTKLGVYILPIDVPCPAKEVWEQLREGLNSSQTDVVLPQFNGKKGHPVLLAKKFINHLLLCNASSRLDVEIKKQLEINRVKIITVQDQMITFNLNTKEDWLEWQSIFINQLKQLRCKNES